MNGTFIALYDGLQISHQECVSVLKGLCKKDGAVSCVGFDAPWSVRRFSGHPWIPTWTR